MGVHIGVVVAVVLGDSPIRGVAQNADLGPAVPVVFPVLVEDDDEACLNDIFDADDRAVVIAFHCGVSPDGHIFVNEDGTFIFSPRTFFGFKAVVNGCAFGVAGDGDFLRLIIGASSRVEGRGCHCGRAAFTLHEDVEEEVVLAIGQIGSGISATSIGIVIETKSEGAGVSAHVGDIETVVVRNE